jgi:transcriptional regulator with XRE-family HTH domain
MPKPRKRLRELRGIRTQREIAEQLGFSVPTLSSYERGDRTPSDKRKQLIADFYGATVQELFFALDAHNE